MPLGCGHCILCYYISSAFAYTVKLCVLPGSLMESGCSNDSTVDSSTRKKCDSREPADMRESAEMCFVLHPEHFYEPYFWLGLPHMITCDHAVLFSRVAVHLGSVMLPHTSLWLKPHLVMLSSSFMPYGLSLRSRFGMLSNLQTTLHIAQAASP